MELKNLSELAELYSTDKIVSPGYLENYEKYFSRMRNEKITLLELGVLAGGSLHLWQNYFPKGEVIGVDKNDSPFKVMPERIKFYKGSQDDEMLHAKIQNECAPEGYDIIIDDASHIGTVSRLSFKILFEKYLKNGGIYVIEDWGTGYWNSWPDGKSFEQNFKGSDPDFTNHNFGMVGFIKELIDEVAWRDITHPNYGNKKLNARESVIKELHIYHGQVFILKP